VAVISVDETFQPFKMRVPSVISINNDETNSRAWIKYLSCLCQCLTLFLTHHSIGTHGQWKTLSSLVHKDITSAVQDCLLA